MKTARAKRFRAKDGSFILVAILETKAQPEELSDIQQVAVLARRDLIQLQRIFRDLERKQMLNGDQLALKRKITKTLDSLTRS
jgi:hypothetical protein